MPPMTVIELKQRSHCRAGDHYPSVHAGVLSVAPAARCRHMPTARGNLAGNASLAANDLIELLTARPQPRNQHRRARAIVDVHIPECRDQIALLKADRDEDVGGGRRSK